ncbi:MAG: hypothetical protein HRT77_17735 [Halioglobus sp.]|jgi:hypothetical protein|nr:hypothetical protein [Halioglobus sp.]
MTQRPIVVCPLKFEQRRLERAGVGDVCELHCCGPGEDRLGAWAHALDAQDRLIILAGLAGSLDPELPAGTAWMVQEVVGEPSDRRWTPQALDQAEPVSTTGPRAVVMSTRAPVTSNVSRQAHRENSQATLIDLESARFAQIATARHWPWAIIRGVSDDLSSALPEKAADWVGPDGRTCYPSVMRSLVAKPALIPVLVTLRQHSLEAMEHVAALIMRLAKSTR